MRQHVPVSRAEAAPNESDNGSARILEARQFLELAIRFRRDGWPEKARRYARRALVIFERESQTDRRDLVRTLLCLGAAREDVADHTRAEAEYRRASEILDRLTESTDTLDVQTLRVQTIRGLAGVILAAGQNREAETLLRHALAVAEQTFGSKHADVAMVLHDLGEMYRHTGMLEEASRLHHLALAITEKALGPDHPQTATILYHLGVLEHARGRCAAGEPFARRSAAIWQKTLGADHPQVAAALASLSALLDAQRKAAEAELVHQRAHTILARWFGPGYDKIGGTTGHDAPPARRPPDQGRPGGDPVRYM